MDSDSSWLAISDQMNKEAEYQGSLIDLLREIRASLEDAFALLPDEELGEDEEADVWGAIDAAQESVDLAIHQVTQD